MKLLRLCLFSFFAFLVEAQLQGELEWPDPNDASEASTVPTYPYKKVIKDSFSFVCADTNYVCGPTLTKDNTVFPQGVPFLVPVTNHVSLSADTCGQLLEAHNEGLPGIGTFFDFKCPNGARMYAYVVYECKIKYTVCYVGGSGCFYENFGTPKYCNDEKCGPICPANGGGDPHFTTYDGTAYSYHGQCDLVLCQSASFGSGSGLHVHARTEIVGGWSLISNAAVKIGEDTFELNHNSTHYLNGKSEVDLPTVLAGKYILTSGKETFGSAGKNEQTWYNIELGPLQNIRISNFKTMISVKVDAHLDDTSGMLGMTRKGGLVARDGTTIIEDVNEFGSEWQVTDVEPQLFQEVRAPQYPNSCILPKVNERRLRVTEQTIQRAEEACAGVNNIAARTFCLDDVMLTGDVEMAHPYSKL